MRFLGSAIMASVLVAGGVALLSAPASADDDIYFNHAKGTMSGAAPSTATSQTTTSRQSYITMDPRDAKAAVGASNVDANNPYFNHAEGTMSADSNANYASSPADQNSRYTASYQHYLAVDPRDSKVDSGANHDVDGSNIYFNHAKGTMSGN